MSETEVKRGRKGEDGFIMAIIFFIIALALLKYFFNWSIFEASATPQGQETVSYTHRVIDTIWSYLKVPLTWLWNNVLWPILGLLWKSLLKVLNQASS